MRSELITQIRGSLFLREALPVLLYPAVSAPAAAVTPANLDNERASVRLASLWSLLGGSFWVLIFGRMLHC